MGPVAFVKLFSSTLGTLIVVECSCCGQMNVIRLGAAFHYLEHECSKLEVLCHQYGKSPCPESWPPCLHIISQVTVVLSSERLDRVLEESILWSSTGFSATVCVRDVLASNIFSMIFG